MVEISPLTDARSSELKDLFFNSGLKSGCVHSFSMGDSDEEKLFFEICFQNGECFIIGGTADGAHIYVRARGGRDLMGTAPFPTLKKNKIVDSSFELVTLEVFPIFVENRFYSEGLKMVFRRDKCFEVIVSNVDDTLSVEIL